MNWLWRFLSSSIGKKVQMALTGLLLCGFLTAHLAGNLFLFKGAQAFNHYAAALEGNPLLPIAEIGLLVLFLLHIATAIRVQREDIRARPVRYEMTSWAGGKTISSVTMIFSGLFLLLFLIVHLKSLRFAEDEGNLYRLVMAHLGNRWYAVFYVAAMAALTLHLRHGFYSGFQTLGINHPKYTPVIHWVGWIFAAVVALGFASIAVWAGFFA